jgi:hypothetical protein
MDIHDAREALESPKAIRQFGVAGLFFIPLSLLMLASPWLIDREKLHQYIHFESRQTPSSALEVCGYQKKSSQSQTRVNVNVVHMSTIDSFNGKPTLSAYEINQMSSTSATSTSLLERNMSDSRYRHLGFSTGQLLYQTIELIDGKVTLQQKDFSLFDFWANTPYWQFLPVLILEAQGCFTPPDHFSLAQNLTLDFPGQCGCIPHCTKPTTVSGNSVHVDNLLPLVHLWSGGFYHFLIEVLPRLILAETFSTLPSNVTILLEYRSKFVEDYMVLLGYQSRIKFVQPDTVYCSNSMVIPPHSQCGVGIPEGLLLLRSRILRAINTTDCGNSTKILVIDRSLSQSRSITNHAEMMARLSIEFPMWNFESVQLEKMGIVDQIRQFSGARGVIAPHGAGLSNILFLPPSSFIVEMFPKHYVVKCYMSLAKVLSLTYSGLILSGNFDASSHLTLEEDELKAVIHLLKRHDFDSQNFM